MRGKQGKPAGRLLRRLWWGGGGFRGGGGWDGTSDASAGPTRQRATDRREDRNAGGESGGQHSSVAERKRVVETLYSPNSSTNEREECGTTTTLEGCLRVEKEVVLDGDAAGFSAALDSRQAAAKRADRDRRAAHAPQGSLFEVAASFAGGVSNASTLSVRDGRRWQVVP
jgi:hypothetical protein